MNKKEIIRDCEIHLDNNPCRNTRFERVTFVYGGGPLEMIECELDDPHFVFTDAAARTAKLMQLVYQGGGGSRDRVLELLNGPIMDEEEGTK